VAVSNNAILILCSTLINSAIFGAESSRKLKGKTLEDQGVDGRVVLKCILMK
jgi:hypothetical protein